MTRTAIAVLWLPGCLLAVSSFGEEKPEAKRTISQIMVEAHLRPENRSTRNNLDSKVIDGKATPEEQQQLLKLYQELAERKPTGGDLGDWKKRTGEIVAATQAVIRGEKNAGERLEKARDCKACHVLHRTASQ
jgi:hypothetical protein